MISYLEWELEAVYFLYWRENLIISNPCQFRANEQH